MKIICLLFLGLFIFKSTNAQTPVSQVDSLVSEYRLMAKEIDNQILYKTILNGTGFQDEDVNHYEWLFILYFDAVGSLKRSIGIDEVVIYIMILLEWLHIQHTIPVRTQMVAIR